MNASPSPAAPASSEQIAFPACWTPVGIAILAISVLIILTTAYVLITTRLPLPLKGLLAAQLGCCFLLIKTTLEDMSSVVLTWTSHELIVTRMLGSVSYPWSHIESVKSFDAGATFADRPGEEEGDRAAIGLQMRQSSRIETKKPNAVVPKEVPPIMIVSRSGDDAGKIPKAAQRLTVARNAAGGTPEMRRFGAPPAGKPGKSGKSGKSGKAFRRTQNAA